MSTEEHPAALVLYESVFGNTEKVAKALARGIGRVCEVDCVRVKDFDRSSLPRYGLIAVGAPTQAFSAYKPMKDFLSSLEGVAGLRGKLAFAFDTKIDSRLSGSAAKYIENRFKDLGLETAMPRASAIVSGGTKDNVLKDGEEARFEAIGAELAAAFAKRPVAKAS